TRRAVPRILAAILVGNRHVRELCVGNVVQARDIYAIEFAAKLRQVRPCERLRTAGLTEIVVDLARPELIVRCVLASADPFELRRGHECLPITHLRAVRTVTAKARRPPDSRTARRR